MKPLWRIALLGGMLTMAAPLFAQLHVGIGINIGPPPPRREIIVARPYPDAVWIPGYYRWNGRRHHYLWVRGRWARPPHAHAEWVEGHWEQRHNEWVYFEGRWKDQPGENGHGKDRHGNDRRGKDRHEDNRSGEGRPGRHR